jgi:hypothetical protein
VERLPCGESFARAANWHRDRWWSAVVAQT